MSQNQPSPATQSVCPECLAVIPAVKVSRDGCIVLQKTCPAHGTFETVVWREDPLRGTPSYDSWHRPKTPSHPAAPFTPVAEGCPRDCGLCAEHRQHTCTALLEVTARCDLSCHFCFAKGGETAGADPDLATIKGWFQRLLDAGGPYNIQLSGGEPTVRGDLPEIIALGRSLGFHFIQLNTNGLRLGRDPGYAAALKAAGLASVFLQFDGVDDTVYQAIRGRALWAAKQRAVEACAANDLGVVLVPTLVPAVNVHQIGAIIHFAVQHIPVVRGVHFQPVSYFGRYPEPPADQDRITIPEVMREIDVQTEAQIRISSFKPPGCENAYCSFHGNFVLMPDGKLQPWTKHDASSCCSTPASAEEGAIKARRFVTQFWAPPQKGAVKLGQTPRLGDWEVFLERSRSHSLCISGMAFQDAWTLDLDRLRDCCIHVMHPDGRLIPFCAYNLTSRHGQSLYRPNAVAAS